MIVVAGEALIDLVIAPDGSVVAKLGGGPFNTARTIGRLDVAVTFLGSVSLDRFGEALLRSLTADQVNVSATVRSDLPTTLATAELDDRGSAVYRFYFDGTSAPALDHVPEAAHAPRALHLGTLGLVLEPMAGTLLEYVSTLPQHTLLMLDPNCRPAVVRDRAAYTARVTEACRRADVVKISTDDAEFLAPGRSPLDLARRMVASGSGAVLLTAGSAPTQVVCRGGECSIPTPTVAVADTIGAGDSFGGGFLAHWVLCGYGRSELADVDLVAAAVEAAHDVSAVTCGRVGADPPRREELPARWMRPTSG